MKALVFLFVLVTSSVYSWIGTQAHADRPTDAITTLTCRGAVVQLVRPAQLKVGSPQVVGVDVQADRGTSFVNITHANKLVLAEIVRNNKVVQRRVVQCS